MIPMCFHFPDPEPPLQRPKLPMFNSGGTSGSIRPMDRREMHCPQSISRVSPRRCPQLPLHFPPNILGTVTVTVFRKPAAHLSSSQLLSAQRLRCAITPPTPLTVNTSFNISSSPKSAPDEYDIIPFSRHLAEPANLRLSSASS